MAAIYGIRINGGGNGGIEAPLMSGRRMDALKLNAGETDARRSLGVAAWASDFGSVAGGTSVLDVVGIGLAGSRKCWSVEGV
jgi:hypothetical protein